MHYPIQTDVESTPYSLAQLMMREWLMDTIAATPTKHPCVIHDVFELKPSDGFGSNACDLDDSFVLYALYQAKLIDCDVLDAWVSIYLTPYSNLMDEHDIVCEALQQLDVLNDFEFTKQTYHYPYPTFARQIQNAFYGFFNKVNDQSYPNPKDYEAFPFYALLVNIEDDYVSDYKMTMERFIAYHLRFSYFEVALRHFNDSPDYFVTYEPYAMFFDELTRWSMECTGVDLTRVPHLPESYLRYFHTFNPLRGGGFSCIKSH